jgi:DNA-binding CsgD family transcriptional regulator
VSRDVRVRLPAQSLEALVALVPATLGLAFGVDEVGLPVGVLALWAQGTRGQDAASVVAYLERLEPIDPFSPRRAQVRDAAVLAEADMGGRQALERSHYGRHLRRLGFAPPLCAYLRRDGKVVAGIVLLRALTVPPFDAAAVRLLRELHPLLQDALACGTPVAGADGGGGAACDRAVAAGLTARQAEVAELVAAGVTNACIAATLGMREATVKSHLTSIFAKAGVRSRTELALQMGRR